MRQLGQISLGSAVAVIILVLLITHWNTPQPSEAKPYTSLALATIDFNQNLKTSAKEIKSGEDLLIALDPKDIKNYFPAYFAKTDYDPEIFGEFLPDYLLYTLDQNYDGVIDNQDPLYSKLALVEIKHHGKLVHATPISHSIIQSIILFNVSKNKFEPHIILPDSSKRLIFPEQTSHDNKH